MTEIETPEVAQLRAERDEARAKLARREQRARRRETARRGLVGALVVITAVLIPVTLTATWVHRTVLDTNTYVDTVAPIAKDPAVTAMLSRRITDQLYTALDPQQAVADALPPKAAFLAGPITNGTKDYVQQAVNKVLNSQQFQTLWTQSNRFAHAQLVTALRGDRKLLQATNGTVVLNLTPLLNSALANIQGFASSVSGRQVTLPTLTGNELPADVCARISTALDRPVPATCGQIPLFPAKNLTAARHATRVFDRGVLALLIITPILAALALVLSHRRRRTLLQLTIGGMLGLVVVRRALIWTQGDLINHAQPENRAARSSIVHGVLGGFFDLTAWFLIGGAVIVVVALLSGPYGWARALRGHVAAGAHRSAELTSAAFSGDPARGRDSSSVAWVRSHFDLLRISGVVVAILLLLLLSVSFWVFVVVAALLAVYEIGLHRLRPVSVTLPAS